MYFIHHKVRITGNQIVMEDTLTKMTKNLKIKIAIKNEPT